MSVLHRREYRRLSRALLASATIIAALGALSVRLLLGVLVGDGHAIVVGPGAIGWAWYQPGGFIFATRWGPFVLDRNDDPVEWWVRVESGPRGDGVALIPLWMPLAATLIPGVWLAHRHRHRPGHCPHCNYDLAGLDAGKPCPECGRTPPHVPSSGATP